MHLVSHHRNLKVSPLSRRYYSFYLVFISLVQRNLKKLRAKEFAKSNDDYIPAFLIVSYPISFQHNPHAYPSHYIPVSSMLRWDSEAKSEYSLSKNKKRAIFSNLRGKE